MKVKILIAITLLSICIAGCQTGLVKITPVIAGQPSPHAGYNIGPELYLKTGDLVKVTGAVVYIKGLGPEHLEAGKVPARLR